MRVWQEPKLEKVGPIGSFYRVYARFGVPEVAEYLFHDMLTEEQTLDGEDGVESVAKYELF